MRWRLVAVAVISMAVFGAQTAHAAVIQEQPNYLGLVGYWPFDEGAGTTVEDFSGNGNTGTLSTTGSNLPQWVTGKFGSALSFDGSTNYVDLGTGSQYNFADTTFSVSAWFKTTSASYQIMLSNDESTNGGWGLEMSASSTGCVGFDIKGSTGVDVDEPCASGAYNDGNWHQVVAVVTTNTTTSSGNTISIYVDGTLQTTQAATAGTYLPPSSPHSYIGQRAAGNNFSGDIEGVQIYNYALTATEIAALYIDGAGTANTSSALLTEGTSLANGLVGLWTFDGPTISGTTVDDLSGNGSNGTNNGATPTIGKLGQALSFDGSSSYIDLGNDSAIKVPLPITVSAWVKVSNLDGYYNVLATDGAASLYAGVNMLVNQGGTIEIDYGDDGSPGPGSRRTLDSTAAITANQWYHIVGVIRGPTDMSIYINGVDAGGSYSGTGGAIAYTSNSGEINGDYWDNTFLPGDIDDVRVYNRALSASEVWQLYNVGAATINSSSVNLQAGSSLSQGLVGLWTFDGKDTNWATGQETDESGNGNTGQLIGLSTTTSPTIGVLGQAMSFNGSDYVSVSPWGQLTGSSAETMSLWFQTTMDSDFTLLSWGDQSQYGALSELGYYSGSGLGFLGYGGGSYDLATGLTPYRDGNWHLLTVTVTGGSGGTMTLYVDGVEKNSGSKSLTQNFTWRACALAR